jgi:hypothetical protein
LICSQVTDEGLAHLPQMEQVRMLQLNCPLLTDAGLNYVAQCKNLEDITLGCPLLTPEGIQRLRGLKKVQEFQCLRVNNNRRAAIDLDSTSKSSFINVPTRDVLQLLSDRYGLTIDARALPTEWQDKPFAVDSSGLKFADVLDELLAPAGMGFVLENGNLRVTTKEEGEKAWGGYRAARKAFPDAEIRMDW